MSLTVEAMRHYLLRRADPVAAAVRASVSISPSPWSAGPSAEARANANAKAAELDALSDAQVQSRYAAAIEQDEAERKQQEALRATAERLIQESQLNLWIQDQSRRVMFPAEQARHRVAEAPPAPTPVAARDPTPDLRPRERDSATKIIAGLLAQCFKPADLEQPFTIAKEIRKSLDASGVQLSDDTIAKWVKPAAELLKRK